MPTDARRLALDILLRSETSRRTLADLMATPAVEHLPARERDFLHQLVFGTLRRRGRIDGALAPLLDRPLAELQPEVAQTLRLGAHQILDLRVPARAAIHEAVDLVRERRPRATGLVNAVLRRLDRNGGAAAADAAVDPLGWLTSEGSLPGWLAERWLGELGATTAVARARALRDPPATAFRVHPKRAAAADAALDAAGVASVPGPIPGGHVLQAGSINEPARAGLVYVQDLGSQLAALLAARPGLVADLCAAPGGKTAFLADANPGGTIVAAEASARRTQTLRALLERWGAENVRILRADAARPPFRHGVFDSVLLDAPCSGLATLSRHPDIRWRARPEDLARHAARQRAFLEAAAALVRPEGCLVYAVCSLEPEETTHVARAFLAAHTDFRPAPLPGWCERYRAGEFAAMLPERDHGDGFFAAPLRRSR